MSSASATGNLHIGFVSMRFRGTDGVSLETAKWAEVLQEMGHTCYYLAGESDRPADVTQLVPEAHFSNPQILEITQEAFSRTERPLELTRRILAPSPDSFSSMFS